LPGHVALLTGSVGNPDPNGTTIQFSGAVNGSTGCDGTGQFTYKTTSAVLGTVGAVGTNCKGQKTNTAAANLLDPAPIINCLNFALGNQKTVTITGRVADIDQGGLTVSLSGVASGSAVTNSDGTFSVTTQASALGMVIVTTIDLWGVCSAQTPITIMCPPPAITGFTSMEVGQNLWQFTGTVADPSPAGLVVQLGGLPELAGQTAAVSSSGTFSITVQLQPGETGEATAQTTDWWGQLSNVALDPIIS
jgi:hypothetical protein